MKLCHNPLWFCELWCHDVSRILASIGLHNRLSPVWCQTTTWSKAGIVSNGYLGSTSMKFESEYNVSVFIWFDFDFIFITALGVPETIRCHQLSRQATNLVITSRDLDINAGKTTTTTTMLQGTVHHLPKFQACLNVSQGVHFTTNCSAIIQIRWKLVWCNTIIGYHITLRFCTCQGSTVAVPCAKFYNDHFIIV